MPYIGNQHNVGDHVNNFKVLDDISSHTATFDGSATNVVSAADDTIRIPEHRFIQGQRVTYTNGGGGNIGGLTTGTAYFVSFDSANTIKLATTLANANSNTVINISAVGSGTSHTLNAAFDSVNTKFKITYRSGTSARLNNATQLNVAINNVIQRPNQSALSFTEGFAIEDNHKIVFKVAPTVNDIFWGSIIANTIENFDLRDNEVDNFTGDGSTTEFTLSTIPANNESVMVSLDGVLQHPSDKDTARAYTLIDSIIQFTAAPGNGVEIQVRHIGFAGATTNDVSGFYGRTGNVTLTSNDHITTGDITSRNVNVTGVSTFTQTIKFPDCTVGINTANAPVAIFGNSNDLIIGHDGNSSRIRAAGAGSLILSNPNGIRFQNSSTNHPLLVAIPNGSVSLWNANSKKLETDTKGIVVGTGVTIETNGQATFTGIVTFAGDVSIGGTLTYEDVTNIDSVGIVTARLGVFIPDDNTLKFGNTSASPDLKIEHVSSGSYNKLHASNGYMQYRASAHFINDEASSINFIRCENKGVKLAYNGSNKLTTETGGVNITGVCTATSFSGNGANITNVNATTLDSIDSGSFVRSDASDTLTGGAYTFSSSTDEKLILSGSSSPYIRLKEGTTDKAYWQFNSDGNVYLWNQESNTGIRLGSSINFYDGSYRTIWHSNNDGSGSGLDADTLDGTQGNAMIRGGAQSSVSGWHIDAYRNGSGNSPRLYFSHSSGYGMHINTYNTSSSVYCLELNNNSIDLLKVYNDGRSVFGGNIEPSSNGNFDLGTSSNRWRNLYTNDLNLSNQGSKNDVDGTWGDFTIQEGESDLFLINKRNGKKYKFNLTEVS